jgi:lipoprotein-releasing system permease protein
LLGGTARAAIASTALGVMAMVIAMSLMSGYRYDLERRLLAGNAAIGVYPGFGAEDPDGWQLLTSIEGVEAVHRVSYGQGSIASESAGEPVDATFRGIEAGGPGLAGRRVEIDPHSDGLAAIAVGQDMAAALQVVPGDVVRLTLLEADLVRPRFRYRSARVSEVFRSGFFEFDRSWAVLERGLLEELTGLAGSWELVLEQPAEAARVVTEARALLGPGWEVRNFRDANRDLFDALEVQQRLLFLVLSLIVLVSTFNVASTLVVLLRERLRQLGVLAAIGTPPRVLRMAFLVYGSVLGVLGIALGLAAGSGISWVLDEFEVIRLSSELASVYFLSSVPFRVRWVDLSAIAGFATLVIVLACALPAARAVRLDAADALRYQ